MLIFLCLSFTVLGEWKDEEKKIDYLIERVSQVKGTFVRNGSDHSPLEARDHLRYKLNRAMNSWFAPDKEEWTAVMFIEKIASKSSISGKPYLIRLEDGTTIPAADWLTARLKEYENQ